MARGEGRHAMTKTEYREIADLDLFGALSQKGWWLVGFHRHADGGTRYTIRRTVRT